MNKIELGSNIAKNGFKNEKDVADKFNNYLYDLDAQEWLKIMNYKLNEIEYVKASVLHGFKADVNVKVQIKLKQNIDIQNIQVKLVSNKTGFNQIDKRWLKNYNEMWNFPNQIYELLRYFTGELKPKINNPKDSRRMNLYEFSKEEQKAIINWFSKNKTLVVSDILRGRGEFCAEWILVTHKQDITKWVLQNINKIMNYYSNGDVKISPKGSLLIGKITMQRKGGDGGRETANMLQFKIDPTKIFEIR